MSLRLVAPLVAAGLCFPGCTPSPPLNRTEALVAVSSGPALAASAPAAPAATGARSDWQLVFKDGDGSNGSGSVAVETLENATLFTQRAVGDTEFVSAIVDPKLFAPLQKALQSRCAAYADVNPPDKIPHNNPVQHVSGKFPDHLWGYLNGDGGPGSKLCEFKNGAWKYKGPLDYSGANGWSTSERVHNGFVQVWREHDNENAGYGVCEPIEGKLLFSRGQPRGCRHWITPKTPATDAPIDLSGMKMSIGEDGTAYFVGRGSDKRGKEKWLLDTYSPKAKKAVLLPITDSANADPIEPEVATTKKGAWIVIDKAKLFFASQSQVDPISLPEGAGSIHSMHASRAGGLLLTFSVGKDHKFAMRSPDGKWTVDVLPNELGAAVAHLAEAEDGTIYVGTMPYDGAYRKPMRGIARRSPNGSWTHDSLSLAHNGVAYHPNDYAFTHAGELLIFATPTTDPSAPTAIFRKVGSSTPVVKFAPVVKKDD